MNPHRVPPKASAEESHAAADATHGWVADILLVSFLIFIPNLMMALQLRTLILIHRKDNWWQRLIESYGDMPPAEYTNWMAMNLVLLGIVFSVRQRVLKPLHQIAQALELARKAYNHETGRLPSFSVFNVRLLVSMVVSELSPGQLSQQERNEYLVRQLQHLTPHMFAETIRIHGNVQLAEMLVARIGGTISILPLTNYACEICMVLPSAMIHKTCM